MGSLALVPLAKPASAQAGAGSEASQGASGQHQIRTFHLKHAADQKDADQIMVALRNLLDPRVKIYLLEGRRAVVIDAPPEQLALAERLIGELDQPRKLYRLTYTLTEVKEGNAVSKQRLSMLVADGQKTVLKHGQKVPLATGVFDAGKAASQTQFTYVDVGLNLDATVEEVAGGVQLHSKVEKSSVAEERPAGPQDPVMQQTVLEGTTFLANGKPVDLGRLDLPGSVQQMQVEVVLEPVAY